MSETTNRLEDRVDAVLNLLDRQIVDSDGRLVGKVDDLELTEHGSRLRATGLLTGPAALVPRLGGRHAEAALRWWCRLAPARADRGVPGWIDMDDVSGLGSEVTLRRERDGLVGLQPPAVDDTRRHRLGELLDLNVVGPDGERLRETVSDVRLEPDVDDPARRPTVTTLLVGRTRPGTLLGYDRATVHGPVLVAQALRWLNRHTAQLDWDDIEDIDWEAGTVNARALPTPLREITGH